jgi:hypothetical protein
VSLALITIELETRKKEEEKQSKRKTQMNTVVSLTSHYLIGMIFGLGRGFDLLFVSLNEV